ncbi:hypothetical protein DFH27DRAFT_529930 [Peziza echinospora]|nr:hypothetical protein DFH27DRAFT_529930 [Peziza echinospora]
MVIAIGDFIAIAQLSWTLYQKCYLAAKDTPAEFKALVDDLSTLSQSIQMLQSELRDPDSLLVRAGPDREIMTIEVVKRVKVALEELESVTNKYTDLKIHRKDRKWKVKFWENYKISKDAESLQGVKSKKKRTGYILVPPYSDSKDPLAQLQGAVQNLGAADQTTCTAPDSTTPAGSSGRATSKTLPQLSWSFTNDELNAILMKNSQAKAEAWSAIGIGEWVHAGRWWLLKARLCVAFDQIRNLGKYLSRD